MRGLFANNVPLVYISVTSFCSLCRPLHIAEQRWEVENSHLHKMYPQTTLSSHPGAGKEERRVILCGIYYYSTHTQWCHKTHNNRLSTLIPWGFREASLEIVITSQSFNSFHSCSAHPMWRRVDQSPVKASGLWIEGQHQLIFTEQGFWVGLWVCFPLWERNDSSPTQRVSPK